MDQKLVTVWFAQGLLPTEDYLNRRSAHSEEAGRGAPGADKSNTVTEVLVL